MKVVLCGTGFLGKNIARAMADSALKSARPLQLQITSRNPQRVHAELSGVVPGIMLLPPTSVDVTDPATLPPAFEDADVIISLVGVLRGSEADFTKVQWKGAENVARVAKMFGAKVIHVSAIGADPSSTIPYARTKALAEASILNICPDATIVRPSIVFGPEDDFFNRFFRLSRYLPFLPVFGGGTTRFQPVFVGDVARAIDIMTRRDDQIQSMISGKIVEAGGPDIFTFRQLMELVLRFNGRKRPIVSIPFFMGAIQGAIMEQLPTNLFTLTRAQVDQLRLDNVVNPSPPSNHVSFASFIESYSRTPLQSVYDVLPTYLE
ncbi:NAD(P)-binding protein [Pluteus cervinus]|uniref:NAD(P)-binding protein n=1 Tax=Pluteus cervinus TaxID=181527 RepID=A0ACD3BI21_9AGAR|nr:NAD(P)-binding protein [Pluteus cervinus]